MWQPCRAPCVPWACRKRSTRKSRGLAQALFAFRILNPPSKRATKDILYHASSGDSPGKELGVERCDADDRYEAMIWLHFRKAAITLPAIIG